MAVCRCIDPGCWLSGHHHHRRSGGRFYQHGAWEEHKNWLNFYNTNDMNEDYCYTDYHVAVVMRCVSCVLCSEPKQLSDRHLLMKAKADDIRECQQYVENLNSVYIRWIECEVNTK